MGACVESQSFDRFLTFKNDHSTKTKEMKYFETTALDGQLFEIIKFCITNSLFAKTIK